MKFTINTQEINAAIIAYLPTLGITQGERSVTVDMAVKRGDGGYSASIGLDEPIPVKTEEQYPEERDDLIELTPKTVDKAVSSLIFRDITEEGKIVPVAVDPGSEEGDYTPELESTPEEDVADEAEEVTEDTPALTDDKL